MENFEIRRITSEDISALREIGRQTFYETFSEFNSEENMAKYLHHRFSVEKLAEELCNKDSEFYFALTGGRVIGYLKLNTGEAQTESQDNKAIEIERIYVLREFHGMKVGQLLFDKAFKIARDRKAAFIWLGVWEKNIRALNFYRKNGFVEFDKHIFILGDSRQTDYLMKLEL